MDENQSSVVVLAKSNGQIPQLCIFRFTLSTSYAIIPPMKKSLAHLPKEKQTELMLITEKIAHIAHHAELIFLFGSLCNTIFYHPESLTIIIKQ